MSKVNAAPFARWVDEQTNLSALARTVNLRVGSDVVSEDWFYKGAWRRTGEIDRDFAEDILNCVDVYWWELYDDEPVAPERRARGGKIPGVPCRMTDRELGAAHTLYEREGLSLRGLGVLLYRRFEYSSPASCANALQQAFVRLGLPRRERVEAVVAALTVHGNGRRDLRDPEHPEHERFLAHRYEVRRASGAVRGVNCQGARVQRPRKGAPCQRPAMRDSDFCRYHDPRYTERIAIELEAARAKLGISASAEQRAAA